MLMLNENAVITYSAHFFPQSSSFKSRDKDRQHIKNFKQRIDKLQSINRFALIHSADGSTIFRPQFQNQEAIFPISRLQCLCHSKATKIHEYIHIYGQLILNRNQPFLENYFCFILLYIVEAAFLDLALYSAHQA